MVSATLSETPVSSDIDPFDIQPADTFNILAASLRAAGLAEMLTDDAEYTVFAPTDEAFAKLPGGTLAGLLKDKHQLRAMLEYHVVPGRLTADQIRQISSAKTLEGHPVNILNCSECSRVWINDAEIVDPDIRATNGVVHAIDTVLFP